MLIYILVYKPKGLEILDLLHLLVWLLVKIYIYAELIPCELSMSQVLEFVLMLMVRGFYHMEDMLIGNTHKLIQRNALITLPQVLFSQYNNLDLEVF